MTTQTQPAPPRKDWPARLFMLAFALFMLAQFVIANDKIWDFSFYLLVIPAFTVFAVRNHLSLWRFWAMREMQLIAALLLWLCLGLSWQEGISWFDGFHYLRHTLITLLFILCAISFFYWLSDSARQRFWQAAVAVASVSAAISIIRFLTDETHNWLRLEPIGQLEQPILGAAVYGIVGLVALLRFARNPRKNLTMLGGYLVISVLIYLTYSRGQHLAFGISSLAVILASISPRRRHIALISIAILGAIAVIILLQSSESQMLLRDSHRVVIFSHALDLISQKPLLGWGATRQMQLPLQEITINHPHNLLLGTLYYGGLVGGVLLLALIAQLVRSIRAMPPSPQKTLCAVLLIYTLLSVITDNSALVDSPSPFWTIFWLPLAHIIVQTQKRKNPI